MQNSEATPEQRDPVVHPEPDGKPMAEGDDHFDEIVSAKLAIQDHLRHRGDAYVAGNLLLYYEEGNPQACVAPDVFVVFGVPKKRRRVYELWEEGKAPSVALELTSKSTWLQDLGEKKAVYAMLGVTEYFLFDPCGEYLSPRLRGYSLRRGEYERMRSGPGGALESRKLGLRLVAEAGHLRLLDARSGRTLLTPDEGIEGTRREAARADGEARRANAEATRAKREGERREKAERRAQALEAALQKLRARLNR